MLLPRELLPVNISVTSSPQTLEKISIDKV